MPGHFLAAAPSALPVPGLPGDLACASCVVSCGLGLSHGLDAERQDADAARVDLPGLARLILVVRPGFALHAADDQHAHALLVEVLPVRGVTVPDFHGAQKPPRSSKSPPLVGTGLSKYTFSRSSAAGSSLPFGELPVLGGEPMLPSPQKCVLMLQSPWWLKYPCHVGVGACWGVRRASPITHSRVGWT